MRVLPARCDVRPNPHHISRNANINLWWDLRRISKLRQYRATLWRRRIFNTSPLPSLSAHRARSSGIPVLRLVSRVLVIRLALFQSRGSPRIRLGRFNSIVKSPYLEIGRNTRIIGLPGPLYTGIELRLSGVLAFKRNVHR